MAFTDAKIFETVTGNILFGCHMLTGDAADTSWNAPVNELYGVWIGDILAGSAGVSCTFSGNTVTIGQNTLGVGDTTYVFYVGV
ncbi:MAG: hypothetical protein KJ888_20980 [Gammaproteobacteria bacterium]|uniref:Tail protein n=1 Tax=viral metagenome TaxID=1070528 RepID=A0A6M3LK39_9ZZZZ|nr:hypothetical protein [Gammaproteobacteria bacterium]